jgi:hypothetical protein
MDTFHIVYSGLFTAELIRLCAKARTEGRLSKAKAAITKLIAALETDPNSLGEIVYTLKNIGLPVRHVVRLPWSLHFAVDETRRLVYLSKIELLD